MEYFRLLLEHLAWIEHQCLSGIRDSRKAGSLWGMVRGVGGVRKSIHQSWLAKGLGLGLLCWFWRVFRKRFRRKRQALFKSNPCHLAEIRWSVCMSKSHMSLCLSFSRIDVGLCIHYLFVRLKESKKKDKSLDLAREFKKCIEHESYVYTNCN